MAFGKRSLTPEQQAKLQPDVGEEQITQAAEERMTGQQEETLQLLGPAYAHACSGCGEPTARRALYCVLCAANLKDT